MASLSKSAQQNAIQLIIKSTAISIYLFQHLI
jgi:hypothetical protein